MKKLIPFIFLFFIFAQQFFALSVDENSKSYLTQQASGDELVDEYIALLGEYFVVTERAIQGDTTANNEMTKIAGEITKFTENQLFLEALSKEENQKKINDATQMYVQKIEQLTDDTNNKTLEEQAEIENEDESGTGNDSETIEQYLNLLEQYLEILERMVEEGDETFNQDGFAEITHKLAEITSRSDFSVNDALLLNKTYSDRYQKLMKKLSKIAQQLNVQQQNEQQQ